MKAQHSMPAQAQTPPSRKTTQINPQEHQIQQIFQQIQKQYSITYYYSTLLFPEPVRSQVRILYAFLRYPDEVVDNPLVHQSPEQVAHALDKISQQVYQRWHDQNPLPDLNKIAQVLKKKHAFKITAATTGHDQNSLKYLQPFQDLILYRFVEMAKQLDFQYPWIEAFFHSMKMDLTVKRYQTFASLEEYVYGSAGVVGLMMNRIMQSEKITSSKSSFSYKIDFSKSDPLAESLGTAMQLTNFLRDLREDHQRGRLYFPAEDFRSHQLTESDFQNPHSPAFLEFIRFQIKRIQSYYQQVFQNCQKIPSRSRLAVLTSAYVYYQVLEKISQNPQKLWSHNFKKTFWSFPIAIYRAKQLIKKSGQS